MKYLRYSWYIVRHKYFVFIECCKLGIPFLGIIHDLSKLLPSEFFPYMNHFFGNKDYNDIKRGRNKTGYYKPYDTGDVAFDLAWFYHQKRNPHHWQYWVLPKDGAGFKALEIPLKYRKEMLADWRGAGKAQGTPDTRAWYKANNHKLILGEETKKWIEEQL